MKDDPINFGKVMIEYGGIPYEVESTAVSSEGGLPVVYISIMCSYDMLNVLVEAIRADRNIPAAFESRIRGTRHKRMRLVTVGTPKDRGGFNSVTVTYAASKIDMKKIIPYSPIIIFIFVFSLVFYSIANHYNPDSVFCRYRIYEQSDGTYQVWWVGFARTCELSGASYSDAKAFQIKKAKRLADLMMEGPQGKAVK